MISDVLCEAVDQIAAYLNDSFYDNVYVGANRERIQRLVCEMNNVRASLDAVLANVGENRR